MLFRADGRIEKIDVHTFWNIRAGDIVEEEDMTGDGFGDPFDRDLEKVRRDVKNGLGLIRK